MSVSVVIPTIGRVELVEAVTSVLAQTVQDTSAAQSQALRTASRVSAQPIQDSARRAVANFVAFAPDGCTSVGGFTKRRGTAASALNDRADSVQRAHIPFG